MAGWSGEVDGWGAGREGGGESPLGAGVVLVSKGARKLRPVLQALLQSTAAGGWGVAARSGRNPRDAARAVVASRPRPHTQ